MTTPDYAALDDHAAQDRLEASTRGRRGYMQLRGVFVQKPDGADRKGPLSWFVSDRQYRALLVYLVLLSVWPWLKDEKRPLEAQAWINLLHSRGGGQSLVWSESTLSRSWRYLAGKGLISKQRGAKGRLAVAPLHEDGSGKAYEAPTGEKKDWQQAYFTIPDRLWLTEEFATLGLSGIALLLIIAKETNKISEWSATQDEIGEWYGMHRSTVAKGLAQLRDANLLVEREEWIPAKLSKIRTTKKTYFSLAEDYSTLARERARKAAERKRRRPKSASGSGVPTFAPVEDQGGDEDEP